MNSIIAIIGGSTCTEEETAIAERTGRLLAAQGAIVLCVGLHDSFRNAVDIPRVDGAEAAVAWAMERARAGDGIIGL